jgi:hypothetical protein
MPEDPHDLPDDRGQRDHRRSGGCRSEEASEVAEHRVDPDDLLRIAWRFFSCAAGTCPPEARESFSWRISTLIASAFSGFRTSWTRLSISRIAADQRTARMSAEAPGSDWERG